MTYEDFNEVLMDQIETCIKVLGRKNKEYARGNDKLSNFKKAGVMDNTTPEKALWGMWKKHIVSIMDIIFDLDNGIEPDPDMLNEKIVDMVNYPILLKALLIERRRNSNEKVISGS